MIPERTCIGCREKKEKRNLIRIVKNKKNEFDIDLNYNKDGRGAYICKNIECLQKIEKGKKLEKALKASIPEEFYEKLRGVIIDKG